MHIHVNQIQTRRDAPCRWQSQCGSFQGGQTVTGWLGCTDTSGASRLGDVQDMNHEKHEKLGKANGATGKVMIGLEEASNSDGGKTGEEHEKFAYRV